MKKELLNSSNSSVSGDDTWIYYDRLHFIPAEKKTKEWAAKVLKFAIDNSSPFMDPNEAHIIRERVSGKLDEAAMRKKIDPTDGTASYFHADFKPLPIDKHLDDIVETTVKQMPVNLNVKAADQFSISNREANNRKIQNRGFFVDILNFYNKQLGFPALKPTDDPYKYIANMAAQGQPAQGQPGQAQPAASPLSRKIGIPQKKMIPPELIQSLISQIDSDRLLGIYNQYLHKEGVEVACELGMDYYLNIKNRWVMNYAGLVIGDIKMFNKCLLRMYTSLTTGTPVIEYLRPEDVMISAYSLSDVSDHIHWHYEKNVNYSEFVRMFGAELTQDQLVDVFDRNRTNGAGHNLQYYQCKPLQRSNALIRIGYMEFESQDMEVYANYTIKGNQRTKKMGSDFVPGMKKDRKGEMVKDPNIKDSTRNEQHYNVWYKFYYIPYIFSNSSSSTNVSLEEQPKYIYSFGKLQDQERYGDDERFARSSLIGFYSDKLTWFEIKDRVMKQIDYLWQLFQNDLANIHPHGLNWAYELIVQMVDTVDEGNKNKKTGLEDWAQKLRQTGSTITKLMRDENGKVVGNIPPFTKIETGHLEAAMNKLNAMMGLYNILVKALGQNEFSEGEAAKPRTNSESITTALAVSGKATFFIEEAYSNILETIGTKMLKYFKDIVDAGPSERLQEFTDIVGQAHAAALGEIKDIPLRNLGLYVENVMDEKQKDMVIQIAQAMASAGTLDEATALFLTMVDNLKEAYAVLTFKQAEMEKKKIAEQQQQQEFQMQLANANLQTELAKIKATNDGKMSLEQLMGQIESQMSQMEINLKGHWQIATKEQINKHRIEQDITQSQIQKLNNPEPEEPVAAGA